MKKYLISIAGGFLILFLSFIVSGFILNLNNNDENLVSESAKLVSVSKVENSINPIKLTVDGRLNSKNKIKLFAEVQGTINFSENIFSEGNSFHKDDIILSVKSDEYHMNVKQARSELQNLIASILPDIKVDFNNNFMQWELYFKSFDLDSYLKDLPKPKSEKEKYYLIGKGIQSLFYKVKSLEQRLKKYVIYAPFNGSLINVKTSEGSMVNPGMLLGTFISNKNFELSVNIPSKYADFVLINEKISVVINENKYFGRIIRVNKNIDELSQTVGVHIEFSDDRLKDGMYIKTIIPLNIKRKGFSISRSNLINDKYVYVAENDNTVGIRNVEVVYYDLNSVIVSGLEDNTNIITSNIPGIYKGMKIKISDR